MSKFDEIIDRHGTDALKTDALAERYGDANLTPLWVADMDFATPPFIIDALRRRLEHPVLGYTVEPADYRPAIIDWLRMLHGVEVRPEWLCFIPGIVKGIGLAAECFTRQGDKIIIQPPVYHPFRLVPEALKRRVVYNQLIESPSGHYSINLDELEQLAADGAKMLILSSPHNPAGIVWDRPTLAKVAEIACRHNMLVISDEIHSEMILEGTHTPFWAVSDEAARCSITFAAPTKTFNMAGVVSSYAIVPDPELRSKFFGFLNSMELDEPTMFAPIATIAAYRHGNPWRLEMLEYIKGNIEAVSDYIAENIPQIKVIKPQASFLVWLDCRGLGLSHDRLNHLFIRRAGLALNDGEMFGPGGEGFMRLNIGAPRSVIIAALTQLKQAIDN